MAKTNLMTILTMTVFFIVLGSASAAAGKIIYVDDDAADANDGTSWTNAFSFLQDALAVASAGDEIRVAQGIYTPDHGYVPDPDADDYFGIRVASFQLVDGVILRGGYAGIGQIDPDVRDVEVYMTILSGDLNGNDVDVNYPPYDLINEPTRAENSYHVATGSGTNETAVLDGFIITGGNTSGIAGREGHLHTKGGGMYNDSGSPTVINCTFTGNLADENGGGIYSSEGKLNLINCTFTGNYAGDNGGGICNAGGELSLTNCTFTGNYAEDSGGGIYINSNNPTLTYCVFSWNSTRDGGGIYINSSNPTLTYCVFNGNSTRDGGGGIYINSSNPTLTYCVFNGNSAPDGGGGIYNFDDSNTILSNCTFIGNLARDRLGAGIYNNNSNAILTNCTFTWNKTSGFSFARNGVALGCESTEQTQSTVEIINCIFWDGDNAIWKDDDPFFWKGDNAIWKDDDSIINVSYSNIRGDWPGVGNIDVDPLFVDELGPDYIFGTEDRNLRLAPVSACVDAGDPNYVAGSDETDLDGNPRIVSGLIDMGAYEFQGQIYVDDDAPYDKLPEWEPVISHLEEDGTEIRPFDTIQEAIEIAKDGYTILVRPGVYPKIDFRGKAITVAGTDGAAVIEAWSFGGRTAVQKEDAVTFHTGEGPGSVLKNFIIRDSGMAISLNYGSSPTISNITIVDNDFGIAAYENSNPDIRNCILWNNTNGDLFQCEAQYSCIDSGTSGEGNINVNPLFVDAANSDYHLKSEGWRWNTASQSWTWDDVTSRCIDAGDPCSPLGDEPMSVPRDLDNIYGENRRINMGAFGGTYQASMPPYDWPPAGEDRTAPAPDPAQWAFGGTPQEVYGGGGTFDYQVEMEAEPATDASGQVEYFFECTTESGYSSGWQSTRTYSVLVGRSGQGLRFRVKARDLYLNETAWSEELSTNLDTRQNES